MTISKQTKNKITYKIAILLLFFILILSVMSAITFGSMNISLKEVYKVIIHELFYQSEISQNDDTAIRNVVWLIRAPRVILSMCVGIALSISGVVMQAIVKNPLAEPYILGVSSGASLGATTAIYLGLNTVLGGSAVGTSAFIGAFGVSLIVICISNIGGKATSVKLVLSGMAIGSLCSAFSSFMIFLAHNPNVTQQITFWMLGSFAAAKWPMVSILMCVIIGCLIFFYLCSRPLNLMLLGDDVAVTLGTNLLPWRYCFLLLSSLLVGLCVYAAGTISFVGLIIPHLVRMISGTNHKKLIPLSALSGGIFMIWADVFARIIIPDSEVPIGILVSLIGAPVFIYMMMKKTYGFGGNN